MSSCLLSLLVAHIASTGHVLGVATRGAVGVAILLVLRLVIWLLVIRSLVAGVVVGHMVVGRAVVGAVGCLSLMALAGFSRNAPLRSQL